jgi:hypothetical protein
LDDTDLALLAESVRGKLEHSITFLPNEDGSVLKVYSVLTAEIVICGRDYVRDD